MFFKKKALLHIHRQHVLRHIFSIVVTGVFAAISIAGCSKEAPDPLIGIVSQSKWVQSIRSEPIIKAGDHRDKSIWNDPSAIKVDDGYIMYLSSSVKDPFKPPILPFRAESRDGENWRLNPETPILSTQGTPFVSIETPSVVQYKGVYHMFYTGIYPQDSVPSMAIGHATSIDGLQWQNDLKPVIQATGNPAEWNGFLVGEPGAVVFNNKIYVYFTAMGARPDGNPPQLQTLGLAITEDGINFSAMKRILSQSDLYPPAKGFVGYSTPAATVHRGKIHLVYDVAAFVKNAQPEWQQVALHHAVSVDGEKQFIEDKNPLITRNDIAWAAKGEVLAPSILISNEKIKLWFAGHVGYSGLPDFFAKDMKGSEFGIGYAEMDLNRFLEKEQ